MYKFITGISIGVLIIYTIIVEQGYRYNIGKYYRFGNVRENFITRIALKDIFAAFKIRDYGMINIYQ